MTLDALLTELRAELAGELPLVLHTHQRKGARSTKRYQPEGDQSHASGGTTWHPDVGTGYGTRIGLPFTPAFERRLSHRDWWGIGELAAQSVGEVGDWCRARHQSDLHRSPGRSTSLCERIVSGMAEFGVPLEHVAWREGLDTEHVRDLAVKALRHAYAWRHRRLHAYMRGAIERERDTRVSCPLCEGRSIVMRRPKVA